MADTATCPKITLALHEVMQKCAYVQKSGQNKFHNYRYAGEADLLAVLRPAMVEAGLLLLPSVTQATGPDEYGNTTVRIEYTLAHKDGEVWPEKIVAMGCGNDKNSKGGIGDKGTYKAITGANKYLLFKLFQIETGDDPETNEHDVMPPTGTANGNSSGKPDPKAMAAEMIKALNGAPDLPALDACWDAMRDDLKLLPREEQDKIGGIFDQNAARVFEAQFNAAPDAAALVAAWKHAQGYMGPMSQGLKDRLTVVKDDRKRALTPSAAAE